MKACFNLLSLFLLFLSACQPNPVPSVSSCSTEEVLIEYLESQTVAAAYAVVGENISSISGSWEVPGDPVKVAPHDKNATVVWTVLGLFMSNCAFFSSSAIWNLRDTRWWNLAAAFYPGIEPIPVLSNMHLNTEAPVGGISGAVRREVIPELREQGTEEWVTELESLSTQQMLSERIRDLGFEPAFLVVSLEVNPDRLDCEYYPTVNRDGRKEIRFENLLGEGVAPTVWETVVMEPNPCGAGVVAEGSGVVISWGF